MNLRLVLVLSVALIVAAGAWMSRSGIEKFNAAEKSLAHGDRAGAETYLRGLASENGDAAYLLGNMLSDPKYPEFDLAEAAHYFQLAAERFHTKAMIALGRAYAEGKGVPKNPYHALLWFQGAEATGDRLAVYHRYQTWYQLSETDPSPSGGMETDIRRVLNNPKRMALNEWRVFAFIPWTRSGITLAILGVIAADHGDAYVS